MEGKYDHAPINLDIQPFTIFQVSCMFSPELPRKILGYFLTKQSAAKRLKVSKESYPGYDYKIVEIVVHD
jgi:hypothetical protein